jgi:dTDP-4-dehydrorhamnose reductase
MKILITGARGNLGSEVSKLYPQALKPTREELDITNKEQVFEYIKNNKPDVIIHLAALITINKCEENKQLAWNTNVMGTKNLIDACLKHNRKVYFVYMSTPCIFSGNPKEAPFTEESIPYPKNFYSMSKLLGEMAVRTSVLKDWLVIRGNLVPRKVWPYPKAFIDRWGTYLFADDLAKAIEEAVGKKAKGILHLVGDQRMSMYELAKITTPKVEKMTLSEYSGYPLTQDMSLDTIKWHKYKITKKEGMFVL